MTAGSANRSEGPLALVEEVDRPSTSDPERSEPASARALDERASRLDWLWKTSGVAANLTVAITVAIAALAYRADREAAREVTAENQQREARTASLAYVTRFQTGEVLDARNEVYAAFISLGPEQIPAVGLTDEVRAALVRAMIESRPDPLAMRLALVNIINFYDGVEACREAELCEPSILETSLASYGARFYCFFDGYVRETRQVLRVPELGRGLEAVVERAGGCR